VAPTKAFLSSINDVYGFLPQASVIHNGIDALSYSPMAPSEQEYIAAAGRIWDEAKNIRALEEIASELPWPVCLAGEGECGASNVRAMGRLTPVLMHQFLGHASICAHPACYEPFGLLPLEAALSGCALVLG